MLVKLQIYNGTDWVDAEADADGHLKVAEQGNPVTRLQGYDGDSWENLQVDANKYLKVAEQGTLTVNAQQKVYTGSAWINGGVPLNFESQVLEEKSEEVDGGNESLEHTACPANKLQVITNIVVYDEDTAITIVVWLMGTASMILARETMTGANVPIIVPLYNPVILKATDYIYVQFLSTVNLDYIYSFINGYQVALT